MLALTKRSEVFGAGLNQNYQLGLGEKGQDNEQVPVCVDTLSGAGITKVFAGGFSAALTSQNQILVCGEGNFGVFKTPQKLYMDQVNFTDCIISKF